jgi:hypothetical protein
MRRPATGRPPMRAAAPLAAARIALAAGLLLAASGCRGKGHAEIDGVLIPQATGVVPAAEGVILAVDEGTIDAAEVPRAPVVRLAIGRLVTWDRVSALISRVEAAGGTPVLLVGQHHKLAGFALEDPWDDGGPAIVVHTYVDGKACVQPPGSIEAKCVQSGDRRQIDRAYVRELVREQVKLYGPRVEIDLAAGLRWDDVVRTIDGARTCCFETRVAVRLRPAGP